MVYVIGDLHLSFGVKNKEMDIFGKVWENHTEKIEKSWRENVSEDDTVILAGDFSRAINLNEVLEDFKFINKLPGRKILIKGNHDFWWTTVNKMKTFLIENDIKNVEFMHNNSVILEKEKIALCGSKGWTTQNSIEDFVNIRREVLRLENSIIDMNKKLDKITDKLGYTKICILHYPPVYRANNLKELREKFILEGKTEEDIQKLMDEIDFIKLLKEYEIDKCYYAHLHGKSHKDAIEGEFSGIYLRLVSGDYLDFNLEQINNK